MKNFKLLKIGMVFIFLILLIVATVLLLNNNEKSSKETLNTIENEEVLGTLVVKNGYQLERDIIPNLASIYGITVDEVKEALNKGDSFLVNNDISSFLKMEGIIIPGTYEIVEKNIEVQISSFIKEAENRYNDTKKTNNLSPKEQFILASVVEAECLGEESYKEVASVF